MDAFRSMLDELMGKDRDAPLEERTNTGLKFSDRDVCKYALCGLCPYSMFGNTKSDLGRCEYAIHEEHLAWEQLQSEWNALSHREKERYGYERDLLRLLRRIVADMDKHIERQEDRARIENAPKPLSAAQQAELDALKQQAKSALELSEKAAEAGDVDASMRAADHAEKLQAQYQNQLKHYTEPDRQVSVCKVCGVFILSTDNAQRSHKAGKQFLGWTAIREKLKELENAKYASSSRGGDRHRGGERSSHYPVSSGRDHHKDAKPSRGENGDKAVEDEEDEEGAIKESDDKHYKSRDRSRDRGQRHRRDDRGGGEYHRRRYSRSRSRDRYRRNDRYSSRHRDGGRDYKRRDRSPAREKEKSPRRDEKSPVPNE